MKKIDPRSTQERRLGHLVGSYQSGEIYSFKTKPATQLSPKDTGRYGVLKILGVKDDGIYHVVLDGVFDHPPDIAEVDDLHWLSMAQRGPVCRCADVSWINDLLEFRYVGIVLLNDADAQLLTACETFGPWSNSALVVEGHWRRLYDKAALDDELIHLRELDEKRRIREVEQNEKRLKLLTWEKLLAEQIFPRWDEHPPFPSPLFTQQARDRIRQDILKLRSLGEKPPKGAVRNILKASVSWFNERDAEFGGVIETEEREDLCTVLAKLAFIAGQPSLGKEIDEWRRW